MNKLKIALAQVKQCEDFEVNARTIARYLDEAAAAGVQILCFPETQTVGYRVDIATPETPVPVEKLDELHRRVAQRCGELGMACILGALYRLYRAAHEWRAARQATRNPGIPEAHEDAPEVP